MLQHLYFVDLLLEVSFVRSNDGWQEDMVVIEAKR